MEDCGKPITDPLKEPRCGSSPAAAARPGTPRSSKATSSSRWRIGDAEVWKTYYRRIVKAMRDVDGQRFEWDWNVNAGPGNRCLLLLEGRFTGAVEVTTVIGHTLRRRTATPEPIGMSVPAPSRDSSTASAACSAMKVVAFPARAMPISCWCTSAGTRSGTVYPR